MFRKPIIIPRKPEPDIQEPYGYIYITTNLVNGKKYIGKHYYKSVNTDYLGSGKALTKAIKQYGRKNFISEPIDWASSSEELDEKEYWWTQYLEAVKDPNYYNEIEGGTGYHGGELHPFYGGKNHPAKGTHLSQERIEAMRKLNTGKKLSEETKQKISNSLKGKLAGEKNPMYGHTWSDARKAQRSEESKGENNPFYGKHHTQESIQKIKEHLPDQNGENNPNYGHKWSEEKRAKTNTARPVVQLTLNGEFVSEFSYMRQAVGFDGNYIGACCRGKKSSYKGYKWMYKEDYEKLMQDTTR